MKNIFTALIALFSTTTFAETYNIMPITAVNSSSVLESSIEKMDLDLKLHFYDERISTGTVVVNHEMNQVTLKLDRPMPRCPEGQICILPAVMPQPVTITLPIVDIKTDACGGLVVTAEKDLRPADGMFRRLTVIDNTELICTVVLPQTETIYQTKTARTGTETHSRFEGSALLPAHFDSAAAHAAAFRLSL